jgi:hypothetical protein
MLSQSRKTAILEKFAAFTSPSGVAIEDPFKTPGMQAGAPPRQGAGASLGVGAMNTRPTRPAPAASYDRAAQTPAAPGEAGPLAANMRNQSARGIGNVTRSGKPIGGNTNQQAANPIKLDMSAM